MTKHLAPDVAALKFYLTNYIPEIYNDSGHLFVLKAAPETNNTPSEVHEMMEKMRIDLELPD